MRRRADEGRDSDAAARERLGLAPQRRVRHRILTPRGWATLLGGGATIALLASVAIPVAVPMLARVSAGVARGVARLDPTKSTAAVPDALLARVPFSAEVLDLERIGFSPSAAKESRDPFDSNASGGSADPSQRAAGVDPAGTPRFVEHVEAPAGLAGPLRVEYALDATLTERVYQVLRRARVKRGHAVVLDVRSGRVLAYASADPEALPPLGAYPAASLAKVVTTAASLEHNRRRALQPCLYRGDPYRLTKARVNPTRGGHEATLERALARSYNQCFAQLAVHALGGQETQRAFQRFRWDASPAPGHAAGLIERGEGDYGLGKLGSGLAPSRITAQHAALLAASLRTGEVVDPWWIDRVVDGNGHSLRLPPRAEPYRVMEQATADELRRMLVLTTTSGTARGAFRTRRGPRLGPVRVAGKTGNLSGTDPRARYEWFTGVAPAQDPRVAVAVVQAHGHLWWKMSGQVAADIFAELFCEKRRCSDDRVGRFTGELGLDVAPRLLETTSRLRIPRN